MAFYPFPQEVKQRKTAKQIMSKKYKDDNDGFIFWMGGECPVLEGQLIEVIYRCGERKTCRAMDSHSNDWRVGDHNDNYDQMDIIAYREL